MDLTKCDVCGKQTARNYERYPRTGAAKGWYFVGGGFTEVSLDVCSPQCLSELGTRQIKDNPGPQSVPITTTLLR